VGYEVRAQVYYRKLLPGIVNFLTSKARNSRKEKAVAKEAISIVRERTAAGIDTNGQRFIPYSEGYAKQKQGLVRELKKARGTRKLNQTAGSYPSWLRATGQTLSAMQADVTSAITLRGITLSIRFKFRENESALIASYHNETGAGKSRVKREFLGLSREGTTRRRAEEERLYRAWKNG
jgi:hypothetical protein